MPSLDPDVPTTDPATDAVSGCPNLGMNLNFADAQISMSFRL